jgi:hypothetical protein
MLMIVTRKSGVDRVSAVLVDSARHHGPAGSSWRWIDSRH